MHTCMYLRCGSRTVFVDYFRGACSKCWEVKCESFGSTVSMLELDLEVSPCSNGMARLSISPYTKPTYGPLPFFNSSHPPMCTGGLWPRSTGCIETRAATLFSIQPAETFSNNMRSMGCAAASCRNALPLTHCPVSKATAQEMT